MSLLIYKIKFTMKIEDNSLVGKAKRCHSGRSVYRKLTNINRYRNTESHHQLQ